MAPSKLPISSDNNTAITEIDKSSRVATTTRLNTSRPRLSVPNQCVADGGCNAIAAFDASGSKGTRCGPTIAISTSSKNSPKATIDSGLDFAIAQNCEALDACVSTGRAGTSSLSVILRAASDAIVSSAAALSTGFMIHPLTYAGRSVQR